MTMQAYLSQHFVEKPALAALAGIGVSRFDQLLALGAIPEASYVCNGQTVCSPAFGGIDCGESLSGAFSARSAPAGCAWHTPRHKARSGKPLPRY